MNDTSPKMKEKMIEMIQAKTPEERLAMGCSMFDFSKQLVLSSLKMRKPPLSSQELRRELFLRFYGCDFGYAAKKKILEHLNHA